jgi:phosphoribosylamine--glycine ligase
VKVLVLGGGGREHSLIWKLSQSSLVDKIYAAPGNGGIEEIAECVDIGATDIDRITKFATNVDLVVVGPEAPLADGIANYLPNRKVFGPTKEAATIEADKSFAKNLMKKMGVPTADFKIFNNKDGTISFLETAKYPIVIKASGLAAGKGAFVVKDKKEAFSVIEKVMVERTLGDAGNKVVIEEYLEGEEASLLAFTDGKDFIPLVPSQDHKRLESGDKGPNTGGMGAYAPVPFINEDGVGRIIEQIFEPVVYGLKNEGTIYKGVLYAGLIFTEEGLKVLEFNCRFGDPENQAIMPLLESDLMEPILATIDESLKQISLKWYQGYVTCVVIASGGYPGKYEKGKEIKGLENVRDVTVFHAGTKKEGNKFFTNGGRVLGVTGRGNTLSDSIETTYKDLTKIHFDNMYYRDDIGRRHATD